MKYRRTQWSAVDKQFSENGQRTVFECSNLRVTAGDLKEEKSGIWAVSGYAHVPFSPKFLMGFYSDWSCKCTRQILTP